MSHGFTSMTKQQSKSSHWQSIITASEESQTSMFQCEVHADQWFRHAWNYALSIHSIGTNCDPAFTHTSNSICGKMCGKNVLKSDEMAIRLSMTTRLLLTCFVCAELLTNKGTTVAPTCSILPRSSTLWLWNLSLRWREGDFVTSA